MVAGKERSCLQQDEVQKIKGWEKAVNRLLEGADADIYVTRSNSKLMSSEISTYLTGRYVPISVYISNCGKDETGGYSGGVAGDQTGKTSASQDRRKR